MSDMTSVTIYLNMAGQTSSSRKLARVIRSDKSSVTVEDDYAENRESTYSVYTGRKLAADGSPHPWDFWRMDLEGVSR